MLVPLFIVFFLFVPVPLKRKEEELIITCMNMNVKKKVDLKNETAICEMKCIH